MIKNRLLYLAAWVGSLIFLYAYQQWAAWMIFLTVTFLPLLSLLVSLPAILTAKMSMQMPPSVPMGTPTRLHVTVRSALPTPRWRISVRTSHTMRGEQWYLSADSYCPTSHCGALECAPHRAWICDYMGLFRIPMKKPGNFCLLILPKSRKPARVPDLDALLSHSWRPKPGGGFSENHELRLYRPGDNLRQIHWKLSAKTGDLILREPMVPQDDRLLLWLHLTGSPDTLDKKLGKLLWLSNHLLELGFLHDILIFTGENGHLWTISSIRELETATAEFLRLKPAAQAEGAYPTRHYRWQYCIGGETDED